MASGGYAGKNLVVTFGGTAYESYFRTIGQDENEDQIDITAGSDTWDTSVGGDKHGEASLELVMPSGTAGTAMYGAFALGTEGTLVLQPEGTAAAKPVSTINTARVISRGRPIDRAGEATFSVTLKYNVTTGVTDGANSA